MARFKWNNDINIINWNIEISSVWNPKDQKYKFRNTKHEAWSELYVDNVGNVAEVRKKL